MERSRLRARAAAVFLVFGAAATGPLEPRSAEASVSIALGWDALIARSTAAAVVTPLTATAVWENGRIFTYTHVSVDRGVAGSLATGADAWVRTLGGIAGSVGQRVEGEAVLAAGKPSLLFLHGAPAGAFDVTGRAQGQFPIVSDDPQQPPHLARSASVGMIVPPSLPSPEVAPVLAADVLAGSTVDDAAQTVASAWTKFHAP